MAEFFTDIEFSMPIVHDQCVVVAGDQKYFARFGGYLIDSCRRSGNRLHCHVINPTHDTKHMMHQSRDSAISFSSESLDLDGVHPLEEKTYYYFSRYFVARYLLENCTLSKAYITDMDMIFLKSIALPGNKTVGVTYDPNQPNDWKRSSASFVYVDRAAVWFLQNLIDLYRQLIASNDWSQVEKLQGFHRACKVGLDQVCLSRECAKIAHEDFFLNLRDIRNLTSKHKHKDAVAWHLLRAKKDPDFERIMQQTMEE
jgi:hypothetical protein